MATPPTEIEAALTGVVTAVAGAVATAVVVSDSEPDAALDACTGMGVTSMEHKRSGEQVTEDEEETGKAKARL